MTQFRGPVDWYKLCQTPGDPAGSFWQMRIWSILISVSPFVYLHAWPNDHRQAGLAHYLQLDLVPESMQDHFCTIQGSFACKREIKLLSCTSACHPTVLTISNATCSNCKAVKRTSHFLFFCFHLLFCKFGLIKTSKAIFLFWILRILCHLNLKKKRTHILKIILIWIWLVPHYRFWQLVVIWCLFNIISYAKWSNGDCSIRIILRMCESRQLCCNFSGYAALRVVCFGNWSSR